MVLIISKTQRDSRSISEMLYFMGVLSYATNPSAALSEISTVYSAVIIINPDKLPDKKDYTARLRSYADVPIFALSENDISEDKLIFDGVISNTSYASRILSYLVGFAEMNDTKIPGIYKLAGIDASVQTNFPTYFDKPLQFTKTETMILRALISFYPLRLNAKDILKYAFRQTKIPEKSNVRTHISVMNKKFREIANRNIITSAPGAGYRILTPEIIEAVIK